MSDWNDLVELLLVDLCPLDVHVCAGIYDIFNIRCWNHTIASRGLPSGAEALPCAIAKGIERAFPEVFKPLLGAEVEATGH